MNRERCIVTAEGLSIESETFIIVFIRRPVNAADRPVDKTAALHRT